MTDIRISPSGMGIGMTMGAGAGAMDFTPPPTAAGVAVSVIIPTHNFGCFIEEAVGSVLDQDVSGLEVLVIDDDSTDDTAQRLERIDDHRLRVVRLGRVGVGAARNHGLAIAQGRFLAFLDADDRWRPGKLRRQVELLESEPDVSFVFTNFVRFESTGFHAETQFDLVPELRSIPMRPSRAGDGMVIEGDAFQHLAPLRQLPCWVQTMLIRAARVRGLGFPPDLRLSQDLSYVLHVYRSGAGALIREPLVEVRRHPGNSYRRSLDKLRPDIEAVTRVARELPFGAHRAIVKRRLAYSWLAAAHHYFWSGAALRAGVACARSLWYPGQRRRALVRMMAAPLAPMAVRWRHRIARSNGHARDR